MKALWWTTILLFGCAGATAQQSSTGSSTGASQQSSGSSAQTVQGCLQESGNTFILNASGVQYRVLGGDRDQLKGMNGHTVSVTGDKAGDSITVRSAQDVSSTCESNTSTTNSTATPSTQTEPSEKGKDKDKTGSEEKERPPMSEQPPMGTPPHAENHPIGSAMGEAAEAANYEAASASKPVYAQAAQDDEQRSSKSRDSGSADQNSDNMPQGGSELPLLGAVGFGMLAAGLWRRR